MLILCPYLSHKGYGGGYPTLSSVLPNVADNNISNSDNDAIDGFTINGGVKADTSYI